MRSAVDQGKRIVRAVGAAATAVALTAAPAAAQRASADTAPSACWQFAFGEWSPPLDWNRAGHPGTDSAMANRVQRIRDSVFDHDPVAARNSAMEVQQTRQGLRVMLYPAWWPAGVTLSFDSTLAGGREMRGTAVALVADGGRAPPRAAARARQVPCGRR